MGRSGLKESIILYLSEQDIHWLGKFLKVNEEPYMTWGHTKKQTLRTVKPLRVLQQYGQERVFLIPPPKCCLPRSNIN